MARAPRFPTRLPLVFSALALVASGCRMAPREQLDECHRLSQTLRSENAGLKDQMLALRSQNQDFSERAVDDAGRLATIEQTNRRLETSVQAYQDERTRLESAYKELRASLPDSLHPLSWNSPGEQNQFEPLLTLEPKPNSNPRSGAKHDPELKQAARDLDTWQPSRRSDQSTGHSPASSGARLGL
jgi:hypothetical protein